MISFFDKGTGRQLRCQSPAQTNEAGKCHAAADLSPWSLSASANVDPIPTRVADGAVVLWQSVPIRACQAVEIVNHFPVAKGQFAGQLLCSLLSRAVHVHKPVVAFLQPQHSQVGQSAHREMPEFLMLDLACGIPGRAQDHVFERNSQRQELVHDVQHVFHTRVHAADMQVC